MSSAHFGSEEHLRQAIWKLLRRREEIYGPQPARKELEVANSLFNLGRIPTFEKVGIDHPAYYMWQAATDQGRWYCEALSHNDNSGCRNPECFKFVVRKE